MNKLLEKSLIEYGNPVQYRLQKITDCLDESESYRKITFGERDPEKPHKTILMVGETGTGKTTLINTMINYMCGVRREDKIWIEITDDLNDRSSAQSQTSIITVYCVYIQESSHDLTIIDTPGYEDTCDISSHQNKAMDLLNFCRSEDGLHELDAVCLVINASQTRLTDSQRYIFDAVQSSFGKDIEDNIVLLFTHSDGLSPKNALIAVKEAKIKCAKDEKNQPVYFLFDNRQSMPCNEDYDLLLGQSWDLSHNAVREFFKFLENLKPKALHNTKHVLLKRKQLQANISNLQLRVQEIKEKRKHLKQTQETLEVDRKYFKDKKNFEFNIQVAYKEKIPIYSTKATCCTVCEENCHYPGCWLAINSSWCEVMRDNHCTVCPNKCHHSKHVKEDKIYVTKIKEETRIVEGLEKIHEEKIAAGESVINTLEKELQNLKEEKIKLVMEAFHCVDVLEMIALKTESLFILQHIVFLIRKMKEIKEPEKAKYLNNIKQRAEEH